MEQKIIKDQQDEYKQQILFELERCEDLEALHFVATYLHAINE